MLKKNYRNVNLTCIWQGKDGFEGARMPIGRIGKDKEEVVFQECARRTKDVRNKKLFSGKYCSLVHMKNGLYQIHMKTIDAQSLKDLYNLAFHIYFELIKAFQKIK